MSTPIMRKKLRIVVSHPKYPVKAVTSPRATKALTVKGRVTDALGGWVSERPYMAYHMTYTRRGRPKAAMAYRHWRHARRSGTTIR